MSDLSNTIYGYYVAHFDELSFDKQLHFASRLWLWRHDEFGRTELDRLRPQVTAADNPDAALRQVYEAATTTIFHGSKNAAELRAPYFEKYPELRTVAMLLFRYTFLKTIYGLEARDTLFELFSKDQLDDLVVRLLADTDAVAILSTHAINVIYLYNRVVLGDDAAVDPAQFLQIGARHYDLDKPVELQLYIYLYTHCIIGESQFYARPLPAHYRQTYRQMVDELEQVMAARFEQINLDNKFEFLVCCQLVGKESTLKQRILDEAAQSVSEEGDFLVDRHNSNPQTANTTLDLSEHRNVLYIMANSQYPA